MEAVKLEEDMIEQGSQFLTFELADEQYAIDILKVQEIRGFERTTPIPNTPEYLLGVLNLRGAVVPIVDMRVKFRLSLEAAENPVVILVKHTGKNNERIVGIVVDAVSDVHAIGMEHISKTPDLATNAVKQYVTGLATIDEQMIIMLDIDALIEQGVLEDVMKSATVEEVRS